VPRFFDTSGPNRVTRNYTLPVLARLPGVRGLVDQELYFVLHAPRQVGKTTTLLTLAQELTTEGRYAAVLLSMEQGAPFSRDPGAAEQIDALQDDALLSVLRQIRAGYPTRPEHFPSSLALIGLRDVRDYKQAAGSEGRLGTSSPFNIKAESLTLHSFTEAEVAELYGQHTRGQDARDRDQGVAAEAGGSPGARARAARRVPRGARARYRVVGGLRSQTQGAPACRATGQHRGDDPGRAAGGGGPGLTA